MTWAEWRFSAKRAWQDPIVRWVNIVSVVLWAGVSAFLLLRVIPASARSGIVTMHYNIYLGVDDVRSWPWILAIPGVAAAAILSNAAIAFGSYRTDALAARTLTLLSLIFMVLVSVTSFFLILINL